MAERRMFSKRVINSARFLKMPVSTQCLYFHLGLNADDDGIVEAYMVMNSIGATEDDLKILAAKNFVVVLNEDLVSYITDWTENNKLRPDRKVDSIYKDLLVQILPEVELVEKRQRADVAKKKALPRGSSSDGQPVDVQWTTNGQQMDGVGKGRLGKGRLGEDSSGKKEDATTLASDDIEKEFENLWSLYPKKQGKANALKAYAKERKKNPNLFDAVMSGIEAYNAYIKANKTEPQYIKQGSTWFNQKCWEDDYTIGGANNGKSAKPDGEDARDRWGAFGLEL